MAFKFQIILHFKIYIHWNWYIFGFGSWVPGTEHTYAHVLAGAAIEDLSWFPGITKYHLALMTPAAASSGYQQIWYLGAATST